MLMSSAELASELFACAELDEINSQWVSERNTPRRWEIIRAAYRLAERRAPARPTGLHLLDWDLTPIERAALEDIQFCQLPLVPQYPVLQYFIDFADPERRIGVEVDGRAYHELGRDLVRDGHLRAAGWRIFHVPGWQTWRDDQDPFEYAPEFEDEEFLAEVSRWTHATGAGFFWALSCARYSKYDSISTELLDIAEGVLAAHVLTPRGVRN